MKTHKFAIVFAGLLWGTMGYFVRHMGAHGYSSQDVVIVRSGVASLFFALLILIQNRKLFLVHIKDIWCFLGSGIVSMLFFTYCYYSAISLTSMSTAAILLYTSPAFVMLISLFLFHEKMRKNKLVALAVVIVGCALSSGLGSDSVISAKGLLFGLGSGIGYALYSIFATLAMQRGYDSRTVSFYSTLFATIGACILWGGGKPMGMMIASETDLLWCASVGFITCFLPYLFYTCGLSGVEPGAASIMVAVEPCMATVVGMVAFGEMLTVTTGAGVLLVVAAIVILNFPERRKRTVEKTIVKN
ncbi:MAG: DMT family transporter [Oscillospiraceae bacterium]|jgi:DME family drug/metabolite transporter